MSRCLLLGCSACLSATPAPPTRDDPATLACEVEQTVVCGDELDGTTENGENHVDQWPCVSFGSPGPEARYRFVASEDVTVTVTLTQLEADVDLFVTDFECLSGDCLSSSASGTTDEIVSGPAVRNQPYFLTVDGFEGQTSAFHLAIDCEPEA